MQPLQLGDPPRIADFDLMNRIGTGGMGTVYLGRRAADDTLAAIKLIRHDMVGDPDTRARFDRETTVARQVHSPRVAAVLDAGFDGDRAYLAVEYVQGPTLYEAVTRKGPLAGRQLTDLAEGLADALIAIHSVGLVHRDITPRNVLLTHSGPCIIDFGIARMDSDAPLTVTGGITGTPGYVAPERLLHGQSLAASDVFSVGALLVFAATGRLPYGAGTAMEVHMRVVNSAGAPDLTGVPGPLLPIVRACLAPDPARRPTGRQLKQMVQAFPAAQQADGGTLVADQVSFASTMPDVRPTAAGAGRTRRTIILAVTAVVLAAVVAVIFTAVFHSSGGSTLKAGTYTINRQLYHGAGYAVTLTTMEVNSAGKVTATVSYQNIGALPVVLSCLGLSDPSINKLSRPGGTTFEASHSYCSDHSGASAVIPAGGASSSYATFEGVTGPAGPFTFTWQQSQTVSGTLDNITL